MRKEFIDDIYLNLQNLSKTNFCNGISSFQDAIPNKFMMPGIYFILDPNLKIQDLKFQRIVRIGITKGVNSNRLSFHRNGNISNSIFRKHISNSLNSTYNEVIEATISEYIFSLNYLFLPINNQSELKALEKSLISILSNKNQTPIYQPDKNWLGFNNGMRVNKSIPSSHLWNVQHTNSYDVLNTQEHDESLIYLNQHISLLD